MLFRSGTLLAAKGMPCCGSKEGKGWESNKSVCFALPCVYGCAGCSRCATAHVPANHPTNHWCH